jgi:outer membrane protein
MKKLTTTVFIALAMMSTGAAADFKAAFINSAIILQQAPQAQQAIADMKSEFQGRETSLRALAEEIKAEEQNLQKDAAIMSPDQKKKLTSDLVEKQRKLRFDAQSLKEDLDLRRKQEIQKLRTEITAVIQKYAKDEGYDMIFTEGVAYAADPVNITDDILNILKK